MSLSTSDTAGTVLNQTALNHFNQLIEQGQFPAANPPPGVTSNLIDPEGRGWLASMTVGIGVPMYGPLAVFRQTSID